HNWDNNINVFDSTVTSGSDYILDSAYTTDTGTFGTGHFGNSDVIGGATTSKAHTAVKIEQNYSGPTVYVQNASRTVGVVAALLS
ncbi:hypothetical protein MJM59_30550, partial [Salmonella enterica subsp. enterica serovar Montevideo]|nr:hypothetical protein [Salmonella enterica subsp. enterica serovar Montevideo]